MGGNIFKCSSKIPSHCIEPTIYNFAKVIRWNEIFPTKNIFDNLVGSYLLDYVNDIDLVLDIKEFYNNLKEQSVFFENNISFDDDLQSSLKIYDKALRENLTGIKESKIIDGKEKKITASKGLIKSLIEPLIINFLNKLEFNSSTALKEFYDIEISSYKNLIENNESDQDYRKITRYENIINEIKNEMIDFKNQKSLSYIINDDFFAMNGLLSFIFPAFSDNNKLYVNENNKNCFIQIDLMLGSEKWQKNYKKGISDNSYNKASLRNILLQSIISNLSKKSEKRFFFKLLNYFETNDPNILGHIKNLIENQEKHDEKIFILKNERILNKNNKEKIKELNKQIDELEHQNYNSRYLSVDQSHGVLLTTVVYEYKNGKRLVSKYKKEKIKLTDDINIFLECLFNDKIEYLNIDTFEKCYNIFLEKCSIGLFSDIEQEYILNDLKDSISENKIEINDWLKNELKIL